MHLKITLKMLFLIIILNIIPNEAARILGVFPTPSISHQIVFRPLTQELARKGHEVTVITTDPAFPDGQTPANLTEIDIHDVTYRVWIDRVVKEESGQSGLPAQYTAMMEALLILFENLLQHQEIQHIINNKRFDLLLLEGCFNIALIFSHIYKVPVIQVSSFGGMLRNYESMGVPTHPLLYPAPPRQKLYNLTMWDKFVEVYNHYSINNIVDGNMKAEDELLRRYFGPDTPSLFELSDNVDMLFLNVNPIFAGVRPVPLSVIYMGGLHQTPDQELPVDLKTYLDSSKNGIIYISFGTNVEPSLLPAEKIQAFIRVLSQLPYEVLWKWDKDEMPGRSDNIQIFKWLPQSDLLKHPKIKLFVTQGGLQSIDEAITAGIPMIGIPMLGDQWYNVEMCVYHNIGIKLVMDTLTENELMEAIKRITEDDSYHHNVVRLRGLMTDQPQRPLERAVWWTEHVLRHGGARHLRAPAANITWPEYLELQLVLVLFGFLLIITCIIVLGINYLYNYIKRIDIISLVKRKYENYRN